MVGQINKHSRKQMIKNTCKGLDNSNDFSYLCGAFFHKQKNHNHVQLLQKETYPRSNPKTKKIVQKTIVISEIYERQL